MNNIANLKDKATDAGAQVIYERLLMPLLWKEAGDKDKGEARAAFKAAMDAAFATGQVGVYIKDQGKPSPVNDKIVSWVKEVLDKRTTFQKSQFKMTGDTALRVLNQLFDAAEGMMRDINSQPQ